MIEFLKTNIDIITFILILLFLPIYKIIYAYKKRKENLLNLGEKLYESKKDTLEIKLYIIILSLLLYRTISYINDERLGELIEIARKARVTIDFMIFLVIIFWRVLNILDRKLLKIGVYEKGIITKRGDFIPWVSMEAIYVATPTGRWSGGGYKIINIHLKGESKKSKEKYEIYIDSEVYKEVLEEIANNTGMKFGESL